MLYCVTLACLELNLQVQLWRSNLASLAALTVSLTSKSVVLQRGRRWWGRTFLWLMGALRYELLWNERRGHLCKEEPASSTGGCRGFVGGEEKEGWIKADLSACHNVGLPWWGYISGQNGMESHCSRDQIMAYLDRIMVQIWPVDANILTLVQ